MTEWTQRGYEDSKLASRYIEYRPKPPMKLVERIIDFVKEKHSGDLNMCVDVGCGSGQCTVLLAPYFKKVIATDISASQIEVAKSRNNLDNVEFQVSAAEQCPVDSGSVQLLNSSAAAHWFDIPNFLKEVDRVLCSNGVVALSGYGFRVDFLHETKSQELFEALMLLYKTRLGPYWASGVLHTENEYQDIVIPYENSLREEFWAEETQTLKSFVDYLSSFCSYTRYCEINGESAGHEILEEFANSCKRILETSDEPERVELKYKRKYFLLMGRKP